VRRSSGSPTWRGRDGRALRGLGYSEVYIKPIVPDEVAAGVRRLADRQAVARETGLYGESEAIREVLVKVEQMAPVSSTVLVEGRVGQARSWSRARCIGWDRGGVGRYRGECGRATGDVCSRASCSGHEKGAFTGAAERRIGRVELADTGTLFLDEIGDIPPATQVKLLRVLEEREVTRVGGTQAIR